jgi:hypothetical protein
MQKILINAPAHAINVRTRRIKNHNCIRIYIGKIKRHAYDLPRSGTTGVWGLAPRKWPIADRLCMSRNVLTIKAGVTPQSECMQRMNDFH